MIGVHSRPLVAIGLGGIAQGWLPHVLLYCQTGVLPFSQITLVDGKDFRHRTRDRQHFHKTRNKAVELCTLWQRVYPDLSLRSRALFVNADNIDEIVTEQSVVLLSPDNHATRKLVSDHAETLENVLLIAGGNDAIDESGRDGTEGAVVVHFRACGRDLTPPLTRYHPDVSDSTDTLPTEAGCEELMLSQPQLLATNVFVGTVMAWMLHHYCTVDDNEAVLVVEVWVNSRTGTLVQYGIDERPL